MEVNYQEKGEAGKTCAECANFQQKTEGSTEGLCFGHDVSAEGSCNFFSLNK